MRHNILSAAIVAVCTVSASFVVHATTFEYDYTYDGSSLTTNQTAAGSALAISDVVTLTLHAQGNDFWSASANQNVWAPIAMNEEATRTGDANWSFLLDGAVVDSGSYSNQVSEFVHIVNFTNPTVAINFDEFMWTFTLTNLALTNEIVTTNTLGEIFFTPNPFWEGGAPTYTRVQNQIPEPTSLALLGLGLAGLCLARRRKS